jgi:hypothetical protein
MYIIFQNNIFQKFLRIFFFVSKEKVFMRKKMENLLEHDGIFHFHHEILGQQQNISSTPKC